MKRLLIIAAWLGVFGAGSGALAMRFFAEDRRAFLPGDTTSGHHQIEQQCSLCHTLAGGVREDACSNCHAQELKLAEDSHPATKFTDPRNAELRETLDATQCVLCHKEHVPAVTRPMGVTLPDDYCQHCHAKVGEERPTHKGLAFDSCASAGCHNFHDNLALYQSFLLRHAEDPDQLPVQVLAAFNSAATPADVPAPDAPADKITMALVSAWRRSAHASKGVNCRSCHETAEAPNVWRDEVPLPVCQTCHEGPVAGFLAGKHGMRIAAELPPLRVDQARLPMRTDAKAHELSCVSCHSDHEFDTKRAATDACLGCHNDAHTQAYEASTHAQLWRKELRFELPAGAGVSCAGCHMPRTVAGGDVPVLRVEHNQNANLRPNEKMIRGVCQSCHGLRFSLNALADADLVTRNFVGSPKTRVASVDMAIEQAAANKKTKKGKR